MDFPRSGAQGPFPLPSPPLSSYVCLLAPAGTTLLLEHGEGGAGMDWVVWEKGFEGDKEETDSARSTDSVTGWVVLEKSTPIFRGLTCVPRLSK